MPTLSDAIKAAQRGLSNKTSISAASQTKPPRLPKSPRVVTPNTIQTPKIDTTALTPGPTINDTSRVRPMAVTARQAVINRLQTKRDDRS